MGNIICLQLFTGYTSNQNSIFLEISQNLKYQADIFPGNTLFATTGSYFKIVMPLTEKRLFSAAELSDKNYFRATLHIHRTSQFSWRKILTGTVSDSDPVSFQQIRRHLAE